MENWQKKTLVTAISVALIPISTTVWAQDGAASEESLYDDPILEEVIVTARKREESLQEVPVAVSVFSQEALREAGIQTVRDLFDNTPGLNWDTDYDQNSSTPAIRGVSSTEIATYRQKVTTFLDGMPIIGQQGSVPFNAVKQVEVLRGPQSAAFGRSTFGGAINYITVDPLEEFGGNVTLEVGNNALFNASAIISGPLSDSFSALLSVERRQRDGEDDWVTIEEGETLGGEEYSNALFKLVYSPSDKLKIEFRYKYLDMDNEQTPRAFAPLDSPERQVHPDAVAKGPPGTPLVCGLGAPTPACAWIGSVYPYPQEYDYNYEATGIDEPFVRTERDRYELAGEFEFDSGMILDVMGFYSDEYYERSTDSNLTNDIRGFERDPTDINEKYFETRLTSVSDGKLRWNVGFSYYDYDFATAIYRRRDWWDAGRATALINEAAENMGIFGNITYDITDKFTASFEARYQSDDVSGGAPQTDGSDLTLNQETTAFLPRLGLTYSFSANTTVYFQYAKGNNPAGVNVGAINAEYLAGAEAYPEITGDPMDVAFFDEEEVDSYEIGIKGILAGRFRYALNAYWLDWENYTQPFIVNNEPDDFIDEDDDGIGDEGTKYEGMRFAVPGRNFIGSGDVEGKGVELETYYAVTENFGIGLVGAYIDIKYADNACATGALDYGVPADTINNAGLSCVSTAGAQLATQPELSGSISFNYHDQLSNGMEWSARWNTRYTGSQYVTEMNLAEMGSFSISSLRLGLSRDAWRVTAYVDNIFGEDAPQGPRIFFDGRIPGPPPFARNLVYTARRDTAYGLMFSYYFGG